jgi:hypothetical protein
MSPHTFRRRGRRRGHAAAAQAPESPAQSEPARPAPSCPVCGQPVRDLPSAVAHRPGGEPAHFDCILNEVRSANQLGPQERICYLGSGAFGVVTFRTEGNLGSYVIKRRIQYEDREHLPEWKKQLQVGS